MTEYAWQDFRLSPDDRVAAMTGPVQVLDHTRQRHCRVTTEAIHD